MVGLSPSWHRGTPTAYCPVVDSALKEAGVTKEQLNAIAYTRGPGLLGHSW